MSFLDHAMILFGVALGSFFAGWLVEWLRFGAVLEQHKQITESLTKQYGELEKRLTFSKSANKDLSDARFAAERERDAAVAKWLLDATKDIPTRDLAFTSPVSQTGPILHSVREVLKSKPKKRARK